MVKNIFLHSISLLLFLLITSCKKPPLLQNILGVYYAQDGNYLGNIITLKENGVCTIEYNNYAEKIEYNQDGFSLLFSNNYTAHLVDDNEFYFSETNQTLNSNYCDFDNDGFNDTDSNTQQYLDETICYTYQK